MKDMFKALRIFDAKNPDAKLSHMSIDDLTPGEVLVKTEYSSLNYKDALAVTGRGKILRRTPLNAGIDLAGEVVKSAHAVFKPGMKVLATGCGVGEERDGGYSEYCRLPPESVIAIPEGRTCQEAMIFGTAGFTAGLCLARMQQNGQDPKKGPILVTGASGGVGSVAVSLFSKKGYEVWAVSGKKEQWDHLEDLGASRVCPPEEFSQKTQPLGKALLGGVVDSVGGNLLSSAAASVDLWGNVACVGLAQSHKLEMTVMPMILRGVSLLGISSNNCPIDLRKNVWQMLFDTFSSDHIQALQTAEISLEDVPEKSEQMLKRQTSGRFVVKIA